MSEYFIVGENNHKSINSNKRRQCIKIAWAKHD